MTGENMSVEELYAQLCLAADEYTSFRCHMQYTPNPERATLEAAVTRADKIVALLKMLRGKQLSQNRGE
jgi:hypothetical protein